ncbi:MAG: AAA family ATPase [Solirubrobacterales bacterium]
MAKTGDPTSDWIHPPADQQGLKRYVETIRERLWLVIAAVIVTTAVAVAYVVSTNKVYEGEADVLISPIPAEAGVVASLGLISESNDPLRAVETAATLIESNAAAEGAAERLGLEAAPRRILRDISVEPVAESNIVTVTARGSTPQATADLANAFARAAIESRTEVLHDRIDEELPRLEARISGLPPGLTRDSLTGQLAQLETLRAGTDPTAQIAELATPPSSAVSPQPVATVIAGLFAGLVLGVGGAFALTVLDPRLRREDQLRDRYRLPVLARIPRERARGDEPLGWDRLSAASIEAYRTLRAILARPLARAGAGSILVTSPGPSEGKTTAAINLATSLALAGKRVILIEADLRRPSIGRTLGVRVERGLISVLIEEATLQDCLVTPDSANENLQLLGAEQAGIWGGELLSLPAAQSLVDEAKLLADYVVIDSPPLATVIDALPLARTVDDVLLVVRLGISRLNRIHELAELLTDTGIRPTGFAVIGVQRTREAYYGDYRRRPSPERSAQPLATRSD